MNEYYFVLNGYSTDIKGRKPIIYKEIKIMSSTFNDLMGFQKSQIVYEMTEQVMEGKLFTWSAESANHKPQAVTVSLDEQSDIPTTLLSEIKPVVSNALHTFNRAPDGYQLEHFLSLPDKAAA